MDINSTGTKSPCCNDLEIWGGLECTINRVKNKYRDQLFLSGHYTRPGDIEHFAALGIRKLRYPILWERHQSRPGQKIDWRWTKKQLDLIRNNRIVPIAGLLHHGSGPGFTDLTDVDFPVKFAAYARQVAEKFPWLVYYTPINEPLTTARFSGLYGLWFPHSTNELTFFKILLNQLKGIVLAMQAIREINPAAQLIQTEDLAKIHSTPVLAYQAEFENERRWLTNDFLCGKVNEQHFFWDYLIQLGISVSELDFFSKNKCYPSILGYNYYVTSERYLNEEVSHYDICTQGNNGRHAYADTEAVREGVHDGLAKLMEEAWHRYNIPLAVTECHLGCTREEQMRWLKETWETCLELLGKGIPVKSLTAWSLLGSYDWNSLLTADDRFYESGIFDISNNRIRATALTKVIRSLAHTENFDHPLVSVKGWWHGKKENKPVEPLLPRQSGIIAPLLIIGKTGTLGQALQKICQQRSIVFVAVSRDQVDILHQHSITCVIEKYRPWAVINATGYGKVEEAETDPLTCYAVNATAPSLMARLCKKYDIPFMSFSSDFVFDGSKKAPYHESDRTLPLNVFGASKAEAERRILAENQSSLIIRTSAFFGPWDKHNFVHTVLQALQTKQYLPLANDVVVSPTYLPDLCQKALDLFIDEEKGIWHLSNEGMLTWAEFGGIIAERTGRKNNILVGMPAVEIGWKARRPLYSALESDKGIKLPSLENALTRFFKTERL